MKHQGYVVYVWGGCTMVLLYRNRDIALAVCKAARAWGNKSTIQAV